MKKIAFFTALLAFTCINSVYALVGASTSGSLDVSTTSWAAAIVGSAADGNPQAAFSYSLNNGNQRRAFAYIKNVGPRNLSSVNIFLSGGNANRTVTVSTCSGSWNTSNGSCSGTISTMLSGPANSASTSIGGLPIGGLIHIRITSVQNTTGSINASAI